MTDNVTGRTYLERGKPVLVLARWSSERAAPWAGIPLVVLSRANGKPPARRGPQNSHQRHTRTHNPRPLVRRSRPDWPSR